MAPVSPAQPQEETQPGILSPINILSDTQGHNRRSLKFHFLGAAAELTHKECEEVGRAARGASQATWAGYGLHLGGASLLGHTGAAVSA